MYIMELYQQIFREMWKKKVRSALAIFGIMWGTMTVILLIALGQGFYKISKQNLMSVADGAFFVIPTTTSMAYKGFPKGQRVKIKTNAIFGVQEKLAGIKSVTPILIQHDDIAFETYKVKKEVIGVAPGVQPIRKILLEKRGRFLNNLDIQNQKHVAVLGYRLKELMFGMASALGKKIIIRQIPFTVIGVIQEAGKNIYNWYDNSALIPYTTFRVLYGDKSVNFFAFLLYPGEDIGKALEDVRNYFADAYHFSPEDEIALRIFDTSKYVDFLNWFFLKKLHIVGDIFQILKM